MFTLIISKRAKSLTKLHIPGLDLHCSVLMIFKYMLYIVHNIPIEFTQHDRNCKTFLFLSFILFVSDNMRMANCNVHNVVIFIEFFSVKLF